MASVIRGAEVESDTEEEEEADISVVTEARADISGVDEYPDISGRGNRTFNLSFVANNLC